MSKIQWYLLCIEYTLEEFWGVGDMGEEGAIRNVLGLYVLNLVTIGALVHIVTGVNVAVLAPAVAGVALGGWIIIRIFVTLGRRECPVEEFLRMETRVDARKRQRAVATYVGASIISFLVFFFIAANGS